MPLGQPIDLNSVLVTCSEVFASQELAIADALQAYLVKDQNLDPAEVAVIVDVDDEEPLARVEGTSGIIRSNGRFYIPSRDKDGAEIKLDAQGWIELTTKFFEEQELEAVFDTEATDLVKFTLFYDGLIIPASSEPAEEQPEEEATEEEAQDPSSEEAPEEDVDEEEADKFLEQLQG